MNNQRLDNQYIVPQLAFDDLDEVKQCLSRIGSECGELAYAISTQALYALERAENQARKFWPPTFTMSMLKKIQLEKTSIKISPELLNFVVEEFLLYSNTNDITLAPDLWILDVDLSDSEHNFLQVKTKKDGHYDRVFTDYIAKVMKYMGWYVEYQDQRLRFIFP